MLFKRASARSLLLFIDCTGTWHSVRPTDCRDNKKAHLPGIYEFLDAARDGAEVWNILGHLAEQPEDLDADFERTSGHFCEFLDLVSMGRHGLGASHGVGERKQRVLCNVTCKLQ
jgi:hypothetical protein